MLQRPHSGLNHVPCFLRRAGPGRRPRRPTAPAGHRKPARAEELPTPRACAGERETPVYSGSAKQPYSNEHGSASTSGLARAAPTLRAWRTQLTSA
jgi:hypothetical protein